MPCCGSAQTVPDGEIASNEAIEKEMKNAKKKLDSEIKLLLLGAGESGKSTIAKQMKIIHQEGFSLDERVQYKSIIYNNVILSMKTLIEAAANLGISISNQDLANQVLENASEENFVSSSAKQIKELWQDAGIRETFNQSSKFQLTDSAGYYFDIIDELAKADYVPTEQHVLRSRAKTTGIIEIEFSVGGTNFRMVDVGGQRSERKKWLHCFQEVTAVIFCVALSEYDLKLQEDDTTNRMHESVKLFKEICNSVWFKKTSMILFLNKKDLFAEKIQKVDLNVCFKEYTGGLSYENGTAFITDMFKKQNENPKKAVYIHITCATDTDNVKVVFSAVRDTIIRDMMSKADLM